MSCLYNELPASGKGRSHLEKKLENVGILSKNRGEGGKVDLENSHIFPFFVQMRASRKDYRQKAVDWQCIAVGNHKYGQCHISHSGPSKNNAIDMIEPLSGVISVVSPFSSLDLFLSFSSQVFVHTKKAFMAKRNLDQNSQLSWSCVIWSIQVSNKALK